MSNRPWMPLYVRDYLADTRTLTNAQHGSYLLLIMEYWLHGSLPTDDRKLAKIAGCSPQAWVSMKQVLRPFFGEGWQHKRINFEMQKREVIALKRSIAGRKGGYCSGTHRAIASELRQNNGGKTKQMRSSHNSKNKPLCSDTARETAERPPAASEMERVRPPAHTTRAEYDELLAKAKNHGRTQ